MCVCVGVRDGCVLATLDPVLSAFFVTSGELRRQDNRKLSKGKLPKNVEMRREKKKETLFEQQPRMSGSHDLSHLHTATYSYSVRMCRERKNP